MWVEKYRPEKIAEVIGNEEAKASFVDWLKSSLWRKKAALLFGPPGVGKTALVYAVANEFKYQIIEMNASDTRTEKSVGKIANPATSLVALDKFSTKTEGSLLFLDEVDGIFGREDRGGIGAIMGIFKKEKKRKRGQRKEIQEPQIPVVLAANDPDLRKLRPLRKICRFIRFRKVPIPRIVALLQKICQMEQIDVEFEALERISQNSKGDVRSAIADLQALCEESRVLRLQDTRRLSSRNRMLPLDDTLKGVFSAKSPGEAKIILDNTTVNYDDLMLLVHDNLPLRYKDPVELDVAYDFLSKADVFRGRVGTENWKFLKYFFNLLAQATTVKFETFKPFEFISFPTRISTLYWTKGKRTTLEAICAKIGARCHVSRKSAKHDFIPFIRAIVKEQKSSPLCTWLQIDSTEMEFLEKLDQL
jgi:replication factor C large subunit